MSNKKKKSAKKQVKRTWPKINWQKYTKLICVLCVVASLAVCLGLIWTKGIPMKRTTSPNERISMQLRWKGHGVYELEYLKAPQGKNVEADFARVFWFSEVEFTASSRYALFVYKGAGKQQCYYAIDYVTGVSGTIDPAYVFRAEVPNRQDATNVKITFQGMDPEFDAAIFRVDYTMANGEDHYEHITYNLQTDHLQ